MLRRFYLRGLREEDFRCRERTLGRGGRDRLGLPGRGLGFGFRRYDRGRHAFRRRRGDMVFDCRFLFRNGFRVPGGGESRQRDRDGLPFQRDDRRYGVDRMEQRRKNGGVDGDRDAHGAETVQSVLLVYHA